MCESEIMPKTSKKLGRTALGLSGSLRLLTTKKQNMRGLCELVRLTTSQELVPLECLVFFG